LIYEAYQAREDFLAPFRLAADLTAAALRTPHAGPMGNLFARSVAAGAELVSRAKLVHERPSYRLETVRMEGREIAVHEEHVLDTPFGTLLHFKKDTRHQQPRVLMVAPMAGHFATLLRDTVKTLLPEHDVYITDWKNARDIPRGAGRFGLDEYLDHLILFLEKIGEGAHVVGVCQPCNALLATTSAMAQMGHAATPRSMTLIAGPVDTRINPTKVNELANEHPIEWFEKNLIAPVPARYKGAHRRVYPGFVQLSAFMSMNMPRHVRAHLDLFKHVMNADHEAADVKRTFYNEYFAVLDLPAEFYLETVNRVFQKHHLAKGIFEWHGNRVDPRAIKKTSLLTIEGERDDICAPGQTRAAHDLCANIKSSAKRHHLQANVGHYGAFAGRKWEAEIYPQVRAHILASD
jgi:poly(3-hydroxybutyrate) depolymerase